MVWSDTASSSFPRTRVVYFKTMMMVVVTRDVNVRDIYAGRFLLCVQYCTTAASTRRGVEWWWLLLLISTIDHYLS
jgi:hypothetical protein